MSKTEKGKGPAEGRIMTFLSRAFDAAPKSITSHPLRSPLRLRRPLRRRKPLIPFSMHRRIQHRSRMQHYYGITSNQFVIFGFR